MILVMWMLAMIMACSAGDQICSYSMPGEVFETQRRCEIVGNLIAGGMMVTPIGQFEQGNVEVQCRSMARADDPQATNPPTELASEPELQVPVSPR
jgi:hypothetical protein